MFHVYYSAPVYVSTTRDLFHMLRVYYPCYLFYVLQVFFNLFLICL